MKSLLEKPRPGAFRAVCRKEEWVPLADVLTLPREQQPDTTVTRWDKKLRLEVCAARCDFATGDRAAYYLAHMAEVHGKKPRGPRQLKPGTGLWNGPKLLPEGKPWVDPSTRKDHAYTQTCATCGLVAEVDDRPANVLWWTEHERMCVGEALPQIGDTVTCIQVGHYGEHPARPDCLLIDGAGRCASPRAVAS